MFDELSKYSNQDHFFFQKGNKLSEVTKEVPEEPGVFCIYRLAKGKIDLVYIGCSGKVLQNGDFKNQMLRSRINNKHGAIKRQEFFKQKFIEEDIDGLDIYWYVTFDEKHADLPSYVKAVLLQRFFEINGRLPEWNEDF